MNTDPNAVKILCYGDSNTYGQKPDKPVRYEANVRWTGVLQELLGNGYHIVEEGLGSRTTNLDYDKKPGRNGRSYLAPCLQSRNPIDIVIMILGANDLKIEYRRSAEDIASALGGLIDDVRTYGETKTGANPKIILISPIEIDDQAPFFAEFYTGYYDSESMKESKKLAEAIEKIADEKDVLFLDAAAVSKPGEDGIHFDIESQRPLAKLIAGVIKQQ